MSEPTSFGAWLRQHRRNHDLTQVELANLVGCAVGTLRNIETDDARPSKQLAARLARILGVPDEQIAALVAFARDNRRAPDEGLASQRVAPSARIPDAPYQTHRTNLPAQLTGLIGRAREIDSVCALMLRPDVRLVTLSGPGGTGKTRVAVASALQLLKTFPNGMIFVDLAAITDAELVLATIAQNVGVTDSGSQPLHVQLAAALRDQTLLLLLDNFEQVIAAAPAVAALLAACPYLKLLVTSRISLGVAGEYEWPVPPLELPDRAHLPPFEQLSQYEAVRLFGERASAVNPQFAITISNAPAVAEICHQLDGLPLAIELVATWVKLFEPQALLARLDHRLTFLTGGGRDRPTRQQTMRNAISWSYQLLIPAEQLLFARLSVFVSGGTLAAISAVCGADEAPSALVQRVAALVNHSLLRRLPITSDIVDTGVDSRFGMLETIREYALEQLDATLDANAVRQRHAQYFTALAEAAAAQWDTPMINTAIAQQRREHDNMRAALQWACDTGNSLVGFRLAAALWGFWRSYGYGSEGRAWLEQLLKLDEHPTDPAAMSARWRGLHEAAWLASDQHDFPIATRLFKESRALRHALGENEGADLLINAAREARSVGQYERAIALLEDALARHRPVSAGMELSFQERGQVLRELALVRRERGDFALAVALLEESLVLYRASSDRVSVALALLGLGDIARDQGDSAKVREYCAPSLAIFRESDMQWAIGFALHNLALAAYVEGDLVQAFAFATEGVALFRSLQAEASLGEILVTFGQIARAQGNSAAAHTALREALRLTRIVGPQLMMVNALEGLASVIIEIGPAATAVRLLAKASALRAQMGTPVRPIDQSFLTHTLASARATLGEDGFAAHWAEAALLSLEEIL